MFSVSNHVASLPPISSPIAKIDKLEGGINKAVLVTAENGKEVVAKIPCPKVALQRYSTVPKVALLEYGELIQFALCRDPTTYIKRNASEV
jgi:hypothetical protein